MVVRQLRRSRCLQRNLLLSVLLKGLVRCEYIQSQGNTSVKTTSFNNSYTHAHTYVYIDIFTRVDFIRDRGRNVFSVISCLEVKELRSCLSCADQSFYQGKKKILSNQNEMLDNIKRNLQKIVDLLTNVCWSMYSCITVLVHHWFSINLAETF